MSGSGVEWIVEAYGCGAGALADVARLQRLFDAVIGELGLHAVDKPLWHKFPGPGGVTGLCLLAESHIACHTFPEYGSLCLNVFCCRLRPEWDFAAYLRREFAAERVSVRCVMRPYRDESSAHHTTNGELSELRRGDPFPVV